MMPKINVLIFVAPLTMIDDGCLSYRHANDAAVEKLRRRLINEDFDAIYKDTPNVTRSQLSFGEFSTLLKSATDEMKAIDPELKWQRSSHTADKAVFKDDNFSWMYLENDGRKLHVQMDWHSDFRLCALSTFGDINDSGKRVFRYCD